MEKIRNKLQKYKNYWKSINGHKSLVRAFIKELWTILVFNTNLELHFHKNTKDQLEAIHLKNLISTAKISKTVTNNDCHKRRLQTAILDPKTSKYILSQKRPQKSSGSFTKEWWAFSVFSQFWFLNFHLDTSYWPTTNHNKKKLSAAKWSKKVISRNELKSRLGALNQ